MYSYENSTGKVNTHYRLRLLAIFLDYWHDNYGTGVLQTQRTCIQFMSFYSDQFRSIMLIIEYTLLIQINMCIGIFKREQYDVFNDLHTRNLAVFSMKHYFANCLFGVQYFFSNFANYNMLYLVWNIFYIHFITISGQLQEKK